jgi:feruloyl esterase
MHPNLRGRGSPGRRTATALARAIAIGLLATTGAAHAAGDCAGLVALTPSDSTVSTAALVAAGTTISGNVLSVAMCRVQGVARPSFDSEIKWEVWLPATAAEWTGRMKVNGTGGYAGAVPFARLAQDIGDGFVTAGSNMGHDGGESPAWTLNRPEKVKDWGLRAHHSVATAAKALASAYFGAPVKHAYFEGCSNGGRQAMMMAQNYPELFDGIVAGAPSQWYPDLLMWLLWTGKTLTPSAPFGPPAISVTKRLLITQRALQACDANDGLVDGQITNPRNCSFDIESMGPAGDGTLTAGELTVAKRMYGGTRRLWDDLGSEQRYTGAAFGSEADWSPLFADNGGYGAFIGHYVYSVTSPPYEWRRDIDWDGVYDRVKTALSPVTAAPSPDIRRFTSRGGKLIQTHGWNDSVVPPDGSINYYFALTQWEKLRNLPSRVVDDHVARLTPQNVAATANAFGHQVQQYHRLFMLPATGHCGGSTGPSAIGGGMPEPPKAYRTADTHAVSAVIKWVEQGVAPDKLVATRFDAQGKLVRSRPLCAYPGQAVYNGTGDINDAANFSCRTPNLPERTVTESDLVNIRNSLTQRTLMLPNR